MKIRVSETGHVAFLVICGFDHCDLHPYIGGMCTGRQYSA